MGTTELSGNRPKGVTQLGGSGDGRLGAGSHRQRLGDRLWTVDYQDYLSVLWDLVGEDGRTRILDCLPRELHALVGRPRGNLDGLVCHHQTSQEVDGREEDSNY